jgi:hypothetical protein
MAHCIEQDVHQVIKGVCTVKRSMSHSHEEVVWSLTGHTFHWGTMCYSYGSLNYKALFS